MLGIVLNCFEFENIRCDLISKKFVYFERKTNKQKKTEKTEKHFFFNDLNLNYCGSSNEIMTQ